MKQFLVILSVLFCSNVFATEHVLTRAPDGGLYFPNVSAVMPGDTIIFTGDYPYARISGLHGTITDTIYLRTKTNARFGTDGDVALSLPDCSFIKIDGRNDAGTPNSMIFGRNGGITYAAQTLTLANSRHYEIGYVEVTMGQVGIFANPSTGPDLGIVYIHHNKIHNLRGINSSEAMYLGYTGKSDTTNPRFLLLTIEYNVMYNLGGDGIQVCCAANYIIRYNTITDFGKQPTLGTHCTGILLGGNARGTASFNIVTTGRGSGMQILGYGTVTVEDNQFINTGTGYGLNPSGVVIVEQPDAIYISKRGGIGSAPLRTVLNRNVVVGAARYGIFNSGESSIAGTWNCNIVSGAVVASYQSNVGDVITMNDCDVEPEDPPVSTPTNLILRGVFFIQL